MTKKALLEKEYRKARKNLMQNVRRYKARGITNIAELPEIPKKITVGSIRKIKSYTPEKLLKNAVYIDETGRKREGYRSIRAAEREQRARTRQREKIKLRGETPSVNNDYISGFEELPTEVDTADMIIENFRAIFEAMSDKARNAATLIIDRYITQYGRLTVAGMIEKGYRNNKFESLPSYEQYKIYYNEHGECERYLYKIFDAGELTESEKEKIHELITSAGNDNDIDDVEDMQEHFNWMNDVEDAGDMPDF